MRTRRNGGAANLRQTGKCRRELDLCEQTKRRVRNALEMPDGGAAFVLAGFVQQVAELLRGRPALLRGVVRLIGIGFPGVQPEGEVEGFPEVGRERLGD